MIISFFGHGNFVYSNIVEDAIMNILNRFQAENIDFYLGEKGAFDGLAKKCCLKLKEKNSNIKIHYITPNINNSHIEPYKNDKDFDSIIYPNLENVYPKYCLLERNKWIVRKSNFIIFYIEYAWGGAYKALKFAESLNKKFINIADKK